MDEFDAWYADSIVFTPGSAIRVQDLVDAFRSTLDPSQHRHWPFNRCLRQLKGSIGRFEPRGPLFVANTWWSRAPLTIGDDGLLQEVE